MHQADKKFRPWEVCSGSERDWWQGARKQGDALLATGRLRDVLLIAGQVERGILGGTSAATDILKALRDTGLASKQTLQARHLAPHVLNRPLETDRLKTLVVNILRQGFDWNACAGAICVQDVPGTFETEHASDCACPPAPSFRTPGLGAARLRSVFVAPRARGTPLRGVQRPVGERAERRHDLMDY